MHPLEYLNHLIGKSLCYGLKSPDTDLYDFGFGDTSAAYILHATCRFKVIWKTGQQNVRIYHEDTPSEQFHTESWRFFSADPNLPHLVAADTWMDFSA